MFIPEVYYIWFPHTYTSIYGHSLFLAAEIYLKLGSLGKIFSNIFFKIYKLF